VTIIAEFLLFSVSHQAQLAIANKAVFFGDARLYRRHGAAAA
jgi:hypothetical protein